MDPNATLRELLIYARTIDRSEGEGFAANDAAELAELALALDEWLTKGGALPDRWKVKRDGGDPAAPTVGPKL
jgi:hypothetical protein